MVTTAPDVVPAPSMMAVSFGYSATSTQAVGVPYLFQMVISSL